MHIDIAILVWRKQPLPLTLLLLFHTKKWLQFIILIGLGIGYLFQEQLKIQITALHYCIHQDFMANAPHK